MFFPVNPDYILHLSAHDCMSPRSCMFRPPPRSSPRRIVDHNTDLALDRHKRILGHRLAVVP